MTTEIVAPDSGDADTLAVRERVLAAPGPQQVLVQVRAAGVNPTDHKSVQGSWPRTAPMLVGFEAAGVVTAVGDDVPDGTVAVGDEVICYPVLGAYASDLLVPAGDVLAKPPTLDWAQAANLLLVGTTAAEMLAVTAVGSGDTVVVHGGSGAVGVSVLQQAARLGARAIATAAERNFGLVRSFGATPVAYGPGLAERLRAALPDGVDASLDCVGTEEALDASLSTTRDRDRIVTIVRGERPAQLGIRFLDGRDPASLAYRNDRRSDLVAMAAAGRLTVPVARTLPLTLDGAQQAFRTLRSGHPRGKLALIPPTA